MKRIEKIVREQATLVAETLADHCCVDREGNLTDIPRTGGSCINCIFNRSSKSCRSFMVNWLLEEVAE